MKQLKKSNFLAVITEQPQTRGEIVEALDEYDFIDSWLTFLIDHFESQNKIIVNEDETIQLRAKKAGGGGNGTLYKVVAHEDGSYEMLTTTIKEMDPNDDGWSKTEKRAIKVATSAIFANYKAQTEAVKALATPEEEADDAEAA